MSDLESTCQHIQGLFTQYLNTQSPTPELLEEVNNIPKQPELIFPMLVLLENNQDPKIERLCATQVNNFMRNSKVYEQNQIDEIFDKLFNALVNVQDDITRNVLVDLAIKESQDKEQILNQLVQLSMQYLQNQPTAKTALRIWGAIMPNPRAYEPNTEFIYTNLVPVAIAALHAEDKSTRLEAYDFFAYGLTTCLNNDEEGQVFTAEYCQSITDEIVTCIQPLIESVQDETEINAFCNNVSIIIDTSYDFAESYLIQAIFEPLITYIGTDGLSSKLKLPLLTPVVSILNSFGIEFADSLPAFIPIVIKLAVEVAHENPEEGLYKRTSSFFEKATIALEDADLTDDSGATLTAMNIYMPSIEELIGLQEAEGLLAVFLIFTSILNINPATVIDLYDDIEGMIETSLGEENELLIESALEFLTNIIYEAPTTAAHIQTKFEPILIELVNSLENITLGNQALLVLMQIYECSETEPADIQTTLQFLMSMFSSDNQIRHEYTFKALSSLIQHMDEIPEDIYPAVKPIIDELISSGEGAIGSAIEGFGAFAAKEPYIVAEDLESMMGVILSALQQTDINLIHSAVITCQNLFEPFCETLAEQVPTFFEASLAIANRISAEDDEEEIAEEGGAQFDVEEGNEEADRLSELVENKQTVCGEALILSTLLFRLAPAALASHAQELQEIIQRFLSLDKPVTIQLAIKASPDLIIGLAQIGQNPAELFKSLIENFGASDDEDTISEFWNGVSFCFHVLPHEVSLELAESSMEIVTSILNGSYSVYNRSNKDGALLKPGLVQQMLVMVEEVLIQTGENFAPFIEATVQGISRLLDDKNPVDRALALVTLSMIASYFPAHEDLIHLVFERLQAEVEQSYQEVKASVFLAYHFLTLANKAAVQEIAPQLLAMAIEAVKDPDGSTQYSLNAGVLWCTLIQQFEIEPSQEDLEAIFSVIPAQAHNNLLKANAIFIYYAINKWPEIITPHALTTAVTVLGSDDVTQTWIPQPVAVTLAQIIANAEEGAAEAVACHNQLEILNYRRHMEQLQQQ